MQMDHRFVSPTWFFFSFCILYPFVNMWWISFLASDHGTTTEQHLHQVWCCWSNAWYNYRVFSQDASLRHNLERGLSFESWHRETRQVCHNQTSVHFFRQRVRHLAKVHVKCSTDWKSGGVTERRQQEILGFGNKTCRWPGSLHRVLQQQRPRSQRR